LHEECLHRQEAEELIGKLQNDVLSAQELYNRTKVELSSKLRDLDKAEGIIEELKNTVKQANQVRLIFNRKFS
jgi:flagellin-specific chaperone FliS